jgi:pimeloyl-ACP methyl ester carboxylesterase
MSRAVAAWARRGRRIGLGGESIFVVDEPPRRGSGAPVLVLHGFPTCSFDWAPVLDALSARHRVVVPDMFGYGFSSKPDRHYSLFDQADMVQGLAAVLDLDDVVLITHDVGDSVGGEIVARDLDGTLTFRVARRVVTNGSIYLDLAQLTEGQKLLMSLPDERLPADAAPDAVALAAALRATLAPGTRVGDENLADHAELIVRGGGNRLLPRLIRYIEERRVHEARWTGAIERHPAPLTVAWGDLDPIAVWSMAERLGRARPDAEVIRLRGLGHYPMLEDPARFAAALSGAL